MAVRLRLMRMGKTKQPVYRVVVMAWTSAPPGMVVT